jgi:hypothetical protein
VPSINRRLLSMKQFHGKGFRVMSPALIVIWNDDHPGARCRWAIRGIQADGSFYGCVTFYDEMRTANLQGQLSQADNAEVWRVANGLRQLAANNGQAADIATCDGFLAEGTLSAPKFIFRYCRGDDQQSVMGQKFDALKSLLRPYAESAIGAP